MSLLEALLSIREDSEYGPNTTMYYFLEAAGRFESDR